MTEMASPEVIREFLLASTELRANGNSMLPSVRHGQILTLCPVGAEFFIGHIYIFIYDGRLLMHRLVAVQGNEAIFMGDHSSGMERVHQSAIIAKFDANYRFLPLSLINFLNMVCLAAGKRRTIAGMVNVIRIWGMKLLCRR